MNKIDLQQFEKYLRRHYRNVKTMQLYMDIAFRYQTQVSHQLNQETLDTFLSIFTNNPANRGGLKALFACFNVKKIDFPKMKGREKKKEYKFLPKEQVDMIINNTTVKTSTMVSLMFDTGLRLAELINLKRSNISLKERTVRGIGKGNKEFEESFSKQTLSKIQAYLKSNKLVYPFHYEGIVHQGKKFRYELNKECIALGLLNIHPHRIRHSLANYLRSRKGFDLEQVREKLRHESVATTQIYATATKEEVKRKMEEVFNEEERDS